MKKIYLLAVAALLSATATAETPLVEVTNIGLTDYTYQVNVPEGQTVKHISVSKPDYEAIAAILQGMGSSMSAASYVDTFGYTVTESESITIDKYGETYYGDAINVYSGMEFMVIAAPVNSEGRVVDGTATVVDFSTLEAGESPFDLDVEESDLTSTSVNLLVVPDEGITEWRGIFEKKAEFDHIAQEGEASVRAFIIGRWDDTQNSVKRAFEGEKEFQLSGLAPDTDYRLGILGFDENRNERLVFYDVTTLSPAGEAPVVELSLAEEAEVDWWNQAAFHIRLEGAKSVTCCSATEEQWAEVLSRPGVTLNNVIRNNGEPMEDWLIEQASTPDGLTFKIEGLNPMTSYRFGVLAISDELLETTSVVEFTTQAMPELGGELRQALLGQWNATTTDENGVSVSFPVTIAEGVDEATTEEYSGRNRLVCLGFGDQEYQSPDQLTEGGMDIAEARKNYGPKWFIQFNEDGSFCVPATAPGYVFDWKMGQDAKGNDLYMWGLAVRPNGNLTDACDMNFPIELSDDHNTLTVLPAENYNEWQDFTFIYYPSVVTSKSVWSYTKVQRFTSPVVLTRVSTSIDEPLINLNNSSEGGAYYDLMGRRVVNPTSGLYIRVSGSKTEKVIL